uniref:E3 ubiquitin-protein ligase arkadia-B-like n=1 Tax=Pristiophorus japonicus TaxID=55135 RepID=UPI00398F0DE4
MEAVPPKQLTVSSEHLPIIDEVKQRSRSQMLNPVIQLFLSIDLNMTDPMDEDDVLVVEPLTSSTLPVSEEVNITSSDSEVEIINVVDDERPSVSGTWIGHTVKKPPSSRLQAPPGHQTTSAEVVDLTLDDNDILTVLDNLHPDDSLSSPEIVQPDLVKGSPSGVSLSANIAATNLPCASFSATAACTSTVTSAASHMESGYVPGLTGYVPGLTGYVPGLTGYVSGLTGYVSGLTGYVSGLTGYVSGLTGYVPGLTTSSRLRAWPDGLCAWPDDLQQ